MIYSEDYDLWQRLSNVTRLSNLHDVLLYLRKHDTNVSTVLSSEASGHSIRVSNHMISDLLKEDVPLGTVRHLWNQKTKTAHEASLAAELVYRMYRAFITSEELCQNEKQIICKDAARRMYGFSKPWLKSACVWGVMARALCLDTLLVITLLNSSKRRLYRMLSNKYLV